jgi:membrane fusion protein, multidrug efflux system
VGKRFVCALMMSALLALAGCSREVPSSAAAQPAPTPSPAAQASPARNPEEFIASGPIVVENQLDVVSQRDGIIAELLVDTGTAVSKGQLLARLDDRQLTADRDAAKAQADSIEADLKNWDATVKMAQVDLDRSEKMWRANLITKEQVEHDRFKLTATQFELDREKKNFARSLAIAKSLNLELEKTRVVAPFDGVVARRYVHVGQRVANGDKVFWVSAVAPLRVKFTLPGKYAGDVKHGSLFDVLPADGPQESHHAKVILVSPVIDPSSGTIDVTAEITGNAGSLRPGMIANLRLEGAK